MKLKKIIALFICISSMMCLFAGCANQPGSSGVKVENGVVNGEITLELYRDVAPITVQNFVDLAKANFYDGLTFHRIIEGFMVQGGDPEGTGMGGSDKEIKGEFSANGISNNLKHTRGVISMARATEPDSASSQFFICHQDASRLDGYYAAFGKVTSGMDVVDALATVETGTNYKPIVTQYMSKVEILEDTEDIVNIKITVGYGEPVSGEITLELYRDVAPITVQNFVDLAKANFYDGLTFHRIIEGFMVQGGDPEGTGLGGSDKEIKGEFSSNGVENDLKHTRGVISMARATEPDSASSQFFICHQDASRLDGYYAAFGKVIEGIEFIDELAAVKTDSNYRPIVIQYMKDVEILEDTETVVKVKITLGK